MRLVMAYEGPARDLPEGLDVLARAGAQMLVHGWRRAARALGAPGRVWQDDGGEWYAEWALPDGARVLAPVKGEDLDTVLELWPGAEVLTA